MKCQYPLEPCDEEGEYTIEDQLSLIFNLVWGSLTRPVLYYCKYHADRIAHELAVDTFEALEAVRPTED